MATMWPLCAVPRTLPAPRISRSRMAILNPVPRVEYCLMALMRLRTSVMSRIAREDQVGVGLVLGAPTRPRSW